MLEFLRELLEQGQVTVPLAPAPVELAKLHEAIARIEARERLELAGDAPALSPAAAAWGLGMIENACRFLVYREFEAEDIAAVMTVKCPQPPSPGVCYSADLFLRYLPDVDNNSPGGWGRPIRL